ncbi:hypothetical protein BSKO_02953 [Bryopsis sp. KO-2023]|nr:hypothetical protein BSKO_02953 [Bryopsis sp. KO-2023]
MKVVALVSGGKDSCYNMMLCERHGHEIVALANLLPMDSGVDELDSYMFQTVGHQLIGAYAQCTGLPLFRRRIRGASVGKDLSYQETDGDEVEDMLALLASAKASYPEIEAVSSGAIASDYQRLRVENVCSRLGLISLAYMWRTPQVCLFDDMLDGGLHAIFVKVAALGLKPKRDLGKTLEDLKETLHVLREQFGCNVCGEGGEYETLVLDCPLFKYGRIVLDKAEVVVESDDPIAPSGMYHPKEFHVEVKSAPGAGKEIDVGDESCAALVKGADISQFEREHKEAISQASSRIRVHKSNGFIHVMSEGISANQGGSNPTDSMQVKGCMYSMLSSIKCCLEENGIPWLQCLFVHMYLADMQGFVHANSVYCMFFPGVDPPSRACVELPLEQGVVCALDVLASTDVDVHGDWPRRVLHVQSFSEWAPCCIGPYSQGTSAGGVVYMAGQLGFDPPSMMLPPGGFRPECENAMEHCQSVAVAINSDVKKSAISFVVYVSKETLEDPLFVVEGNGLASKFLPHYGWWDGQQTDLQSFEETINEELDPYLLPPKLSQSIPPLVIHVCVPKLPKGAAVEVQPLVIDARKFEQLVGHGSDDVKKLERGVAGDQKYDSDLEVIHSFRQKSLYLEKFELRSGALTVQCRVVSVSDTVSKMHMWISSGGGGGDNADELGQLLSRGVQRFLKECGLGWRDICIARAFSRSEFSPVMKAALDRMNGIAKESNFGRLECAFAPVLELGKSMAMEDTAVLDLQSNLGWNKTRTEDIS